MDKSKITLFEDASVIDEKDGEITVALKREDQEPKTPIFCFRLSNRTASQLAQQIIEAFVPSKSYS